MSNDPDIEAEKNRVLELYEIADGTSEAGPGGPTGDLLHGRVRAPQPATPPGKQWASVASGKGTSDAPRRRRRRATYNRPTGVRHLLAAYDLNRDRLYGHIRTKKGRVEFLAFCRYLRSLYPPGVRSAIVLDSFSPHLSTKKDRRVGRWAAANNVELAYVRSTPRG